VTLKSHIVVLVGGSTDFFEFLVEDLYILEVHVGGVEVLAMDLAVEGESQWHVVRILAVLSHTAVAKGFVVVRLEVVLILFDVWRDYDVESEGLTSLLALGQQQILGESAVVVAL
jgi:hypothetical protein